MRGHAAAAAVIAAAAGGVFLAACGPRAPDSEALFAGATQDLEAGRTARGLWGMQRVLHDRPDHAGAHRAIGLRAYSLSDFDEALAHLEAIARTRPLDREETIALGDSRSQENRFAAAESTFAAALEQFGEDARVLEAQAYARSQQGDLEGAAAAARRAIMLDPSLGSARIALATALQDAGKFAESEEILSVAVADSATGHALLGRARERAGDLPAARRHLEAAIRIDPVDLDAHYLLAQVLRRSGDVEAARTAAERHRELIQKAENASSTYARNALVTGAMAEEAGDAPKALATYQDGLEHQPGHTMLLCAAAPLLQSLDRRKEAGAALAALRDAAGGDALGPLFLATGRELRRRGLPRSAAHQFEVAMARMPGNEDAIYLRAVALAEAGDWETARAVAAPLESPAAATKDKSP